MDDGMHVKTAGVGIGATTARISVTIEDYDSLQELDDMFRNSQLSVALEVDPADSHDAEGQTKMLDASTKRLEGIADAKGYSIKSDGRCSVSLTFNKSSVNLGELGGFANSKANITLKRLGPADLDNEDEHDAEDDNE